MIAGLRGEVIEVGADFCIVDVGGVLFQVFCPASTLSLVELGSRVCLHTHLQVREDGMTLYGFAARSEIQMFQLLVGVSGVGPRIALALLSAIPAEELMLVVASEDIVRLSGVPGVGKRIAGRIALELKGKLGQVGVAPTSPAASATAGQLLAALTNLGYTNTEAAEAVRSVPNLGALDLEGGLREALRVLSALR